MAWEVLLLGAARRRHDAAMIEARAAQIVIGVPLGETLERLCAFFGVTRIMVDDGQKETDESLRQRAITEIRRQGIAVKPTSTGST